MDEDNGSIIRTSKRSEKLAAHSREGNIALEIDRPVLPTKSFDEFKADLLSKMDAGDEKTEGLTKPEFHFLDINKEEAED